MQEVSLNWQFSRQCRSFLFSGVAARCFVIGKGKEAEFIPSPGVEGVVKIAPVWS